MPGGFVLLSQEKSTDADKILSYGIIIDYNSRYMWRGMALSEASVIQPSGWIAYRNINLTIWSNFDLKSSSSNRSLNEIDVISSYPIEFKFFSFEPSISLYTYPYTNGQLTTLELGFKISKNLMSNVSLYSANNFEVFRYPGLYYGEIDLNFDKEISGSNSFGISTNVGWSTSKFYTVYAGDSKSGFNAISINLFYNYNFQNGFNIKPRLEFYRIINKQLQETSGNKFIVNYGISLSKDF